MADKKEAENCSKQANVGSSSSEWEERVMIVRRHFERKGYRVHSGLQFGCELVLYADSPELVHSDFCVHVVPCDGSLDWRVLQGLVRLMPDFHKTLILANVKRVESLPEQLSSNESNGSNEYIVEELAMATEHAPFRHKKQNMITEVGTQRKRRKVDSKQFKRPDIKGEK